MDADKKIINTYLNQSITGDLMGTCFALVAYIWLLIYIFHNLFYQIAGYKKLHQQSNSI